MIIRHADEIPPRTRLTLGEARIAADYAKGRRAEKHLVATFKGDGRPIMIIPGMFSNDRRMKMLRRVLEDVGYNAHGWDLGRNMPHRAALLDRIGHRLDEIQGANPAPVTLIGWSLGGLIAREYAKHAPERVAEVITMGSPFSGNPRFNNAWRAYEMFAGHKIDASPFATGLSTKPPVHTTAIWSPRDGFIPPRAARGLPHERDAAVEVQCGHLGYICAPDAMEAVLRVLAGHQ